MAMSATVAAKMAAASAVPSYRVAIIGGGIAGCSAARRLAQLNVPPPSAESRAAAEITLYEMGRGPGGRASTRRTRSLPHLRINHGAPYADLRSARGRSLVASLGAGGAAPFEGRRVVVEASTGAVTADDADEEPASEGSAAVAYVTGADGEMSRIASALLADAPPPARVVTSYKTMVRSLARHPADHTWELRDKADRLLGTADWLIVAGSGVAHPRWSDTFGGPPPLATAEAAAPDARLRAALDAIAQQRASPVLAVFFSCSGDAARRWRALDFQVAGVSGSAVLARVVVQAGKQRETSEGDGEVEDEEDWCSVVLHSTEDFAVKNSGIYGTSSSAARVGGAATDASAERSLIRRMIRALEDIPGMPAAATAAEEGGGAREDADIAAASLSDYSNDDGLVGVTASSYYDYGPALHRWGNAFPRGVPLAADLAFVPSARLAFCGDYVAPLASGPGPARFGSFESALLSGTAAAENIARYYEEQ